MRIQFNSGKRAIINRKNKATDKSQQNHIKRAEFSGKITAVLLIWAISLPVALPVHAFALINPRPIENAPPKMDEFAQQMILPWVENLSKDLSSTPSAATKSSLAIINNLFGLKTPNVADESETKKGEKEDASKSTELAKPISKEALLKRVARIVIESEAEKTVVPGEILQLNALPIDKDGKPVPGLFLEWKSSDSQIIKIKDGNYAVAAKTGEAVLTVEIGDAKSSIAVKVITPLAGKSVTGKTASSAPSVTPLASLVVNQLPDVERESIYSYENNLGSPAGQVEMDSPNGAAATKIKHRAGIANFSFGVPLASLPGRGIDAGAAMTYNSRTWNKSCIQYDPNGICSQNHFTYDVEQSWIAPGFTTGFGYLESRVDTVYYSNGAFLGYKTFPTGLIEPDGTRRELYCTQWSAEACLGFETSDGSFIRVSGQVLNSNPATAEFNAVYPNGSKVYFVGATGTETFRKHYPVMLEDSNGNRIRIAYKSDQTGRVNYIRDTLNRDIKFYYGTDAAGNANQLVAVTIPGMNANEELQTVRFYYQNLTLNAQSGFSGQVTAPSVPIQVLSFVYFPTTKNGFKYEYHPNYGMIKKITRLVGMTVSDAASTSATGTVTSEGTWAATTEYDFPNGSTALSDVPKYTKRTDDWQGRTSATAAETFYDAPEPATAADRVSKISVKDTDYNPANDTYSDFETINETVSYNTGDWMNGLIKETSVKKKFLVNGLTIIMAKTKYFWDQGLANYGRRKNPVLRKVEITNDAGQTKTIRYEYDQYNNQTQADEYDFGQNEELNATPLRTTKTGYEIRASWVNRNNLLSLPVSVETIAGGVTVSKTLLEYDHNGSDATLPRRDDMDDETHSVNYNPDRPEDKWQTICYDGTGNFSSTQPTAPADRCYRIHYPGYISAVSSYRGNVTRIGRMLDLTATTITATNSNKIDYNYDIAGNPISATLSCCQLKTLDYGQSFAETGYAYPVKQTKGTSPQLITETSYNKNTGLMISSKDENDQITTYEYEADTLRQNKVTYPNGAYELIEYSDKIAPNPISYVRTTALLETGKTAQSYSYFDGRGAGIRSAVQTPTGWTVAAMEYDVLGRLKKSYNPFDASAPTSAIPAGTKYTEVLNTDSLGRTMQIRFQDNTTVQSVFNGTVTTAIDQAGKQRRQTADALGRIVRVDEPGLNGNLGAGGNPAQPTVYEYDGNDNLTKIIQTEGAVTQTREFKYDVLSRLIKEKQVEADATLNNDGVFVGVGAGAWTGYYEYDLLGRLAKGVDARGVTTTFSYDGLNRIQTVTYDGESALKTPPVTYTYGSDKTVFNNGRLTRVVTTPTDGYTPATTQSYEYDLMGQIKKQTETVGASNYLMEYDYYLGGGLKKQKYPSGREVIYSIDTAGRISGISDAQRTFANNFQFENGLLKGMSLGNATKETYKFNDRLQIESQSLTKGNTVQQKLVYGYGAVNPTTGAVDANKNNGQIGKIENYFGGNISTPTKQQEQRFTYDSIGRLKQSIEVKPDNTQVYQQTYSYDRFGNRYQEAGYNQNSGMGYQAVEQSDISKSTNRFTSSLVTYDYIGNITTDNRYRTQSYWYDANGRMIRAQKNDGSNQQADSVYDALGQRVATKVNNVWQHFVYDIAGQMVAEYGTQSEGKGAVNYIHQDQQGSTRVVTNANGWVSSRSDYTAFGDEIGGIGQNRTPQYGYNSSSIRQKYALTERDELTGLDHTDWRKLNSILGRWTSPDPYKGSMSVGNPQSFNRYSYVNNDPVNFVDPSGLNAEAPNCPNGTVARKDDLGVWQCVGAGVTSATISWGASNGWLTGPAAILALWNPTRYQSSGTIVVERGGGNSGPGNILPQQQPQPSQVNQRKKDCYAEALKRRDARFAENQRKADQYDTSLSRADYASLVIGGGVGLATGGGGGLVGGVVLGYAGTKLGKYWERGMDLWAANRKTEIKYLQEASWCDKLR